MNLFKNTQSVLPHGGPITGSSRSDLFVPRVKPFYFTAEKETRLYAILRGFDPSFQECPNALDGFRTHLRTLLNDFELHHPGTKTSLLRSYVGMLPMLKSGSHGKVVSCIDCQEPCAGSRCNACSFLELLRSHDIIPREASIHVKEESL